MGRGDRPPHSGAHLGNAVGQPPHYEVVIATEAEDELVELVRYIRKDSKQNADRVLDEVLKRRDLLRTSPGIGHVDPSAPQVPEGAEALLTTVKKIGLYYLFPFKRGDEDIVFIVSIRRGSRMPLDEPEYARRWLEELARIPLEGGSRSEGLPED